MCKKKEDLPDDVSITDKSTGDDISLEIAATDEARSESAHKINNYQEQLLEILKKHGIENKDDIYNALQILCIYEEHECRMGERRLDTGNLLLVNDRQNILHTITIKTTQPCVQLYGLSEFQCAVEKTVTIALNVFVKENMHIDDDTSQPKMLKANKRTEKVITRHFVSIPFAQYVQNAYNLDLPQCFYNIIQSYLSTNGTKSCGNCILYQNYEQTISIVTNTATVAENKNDLEDEQDYQTRMVDIIDDTGYDVSLTVHLSSKTIQESKKIAFCKYIKPIINSFNQKIEKYLHDNKFYQISFETVKEIEIPTRKISIVGGTSKQSGKAKFKCEFSGYNNLNMKTIRNDTNCIIKSEPFQLELESNYYWVEHMLRSCSVAIVNEDNMVDIDKFWNWVSTARNSSHPLYFKMKTCELFDEIELN